MSAKATNSRLVWWERLVTPIGAALGVAILRLLSLTLRGNSVAGIEHLKGRDERPVILSTWHNRSLVTGHFVHRLLVRRGTPVAAMISLSRDGELMARAAGMLGVRVVRGSATSGGLKALRSLRRALLRERWNVGLVADGSRGPVYDCKPGTVILAQTSGAPIVPVLAAAKRCWRLASWDRLIVPKPFSKVVLVVGEPISIPADLTSEEVAERTLRLGESLTRLAHAADELAAGREPQGLAEEPS